jgi:tetratricopeptide (TPR) repeat protein
VEDGNGEPGAGSGERLLACPSVALLVDRARRVQADFALTERNAGAVASLCRRLEGLPLAVELAASRLGVLTPAQMLSRLEERLGLLVSPTRATEARHRSLRATLEWSEELLTEGGRRLLGRLSVFRGGWTLEGAEAVCGEGIEVVAGLCELGDSSLVERTQGEEEPRYRMLETVREYAAERLEASGEGAAVRRRHAGYCVTLPEARVGWQRLEAEHDNLREAMDWAHGEGGDSEIEARLAASLLPFWEARRHLREGRERMLRALSHPDAEHGTLRRARILQGAASLGLMARNPEGARALLEESLAIYRELGHKPGVVDALAWLGNVERLQENPAVAAAQARYEEALVVARETGDPEKIGAMLALLGLVAVERADFRKARTLHEEALAIYQTIGERLSPR